MSLREQLLKKGLVSKADARRSDQESKRARRQKQGAKKRKRAEQAEREAAEQAVRLARQAERLQARAEANAKRDAHQQALQIRNLILGHRVQNRGDQPFWFKSPSGRIARLQVHRRVAEELTKGNLAIALLDQGNRHDFVLIAAAGAEKLEELGATSVLLHWARRIPADEGDGLLQRSWEPSLRPHRVSAAGADDHGE